ncbi:hypothetical protein J6590_092194, partial [Homalodisca vitripennis]
RHCGGMVWGEKQFRVDNSPGGDAAADCLVWSSSVLLRTTLPRTLRWKLQTSAGKFAS